MIARLALRTRLLALQTRLLALGPRFVALGPRFVALAAMLVALGGCFDVIHLRPELRAPASRRDPLALAEALERLIEEGRATTDDRAAAYEAIRGWQADTVEYAFARASLAGRLAQVKGVTAIGLVREMETWGRLAMKLDAKWHQGAARRLVGTMYVLVPGSLVQHGTSEDGVELLEKQAKEFPDDPVNRLRLAEGYVTLGDTDSALAPLCFVVAHEKELKRSDDALLDALLEQLGGRAKLPCDDE